MTTALLAATAPSAAPPPDFGTMPHSAWRDEAAFALEISGCFGDDGPVGRARAHMGRAFRPSAAQRTLAGRYAQAIWRGLPKAVTGSEPLRGLVTMIEGSTGCGKTLGYLLPAASAAIATGRPTVVATNTLALQRQIMEEEAPVVALALRALSGSGFRIASLQGLANYVSVSAVDRLLDPEEDGSPDEKETRSLLRDLARWARASLAGDATGVLRDFLDDRGIERLPSGLPVASVCLDRVSPVEDRAAYLRQRVAAETADVVLVTHSWLLAAMRYGLPLVPGSGDEAAARPCGACICDEGHMLPGVAADALSTDISIRAVEQRIGEAALFALDRRRRRLGAAVAHADTLLLRLRECATGLRDALPGFQASWTEASRILPAESAAFVGEASGAASAVAAVSDALRDMGSFEAQLLAHDLVKDAMQMEDFAVGARRQADSTSSGLHSASLSWSPVHALPRLHLTPNFPGQLIARLWTERPGHPALMDSVVMTSATLQSPGTVRGDGFNIALNEMAAFGPARTSNSDLNCSIEPEAFGTMRIVLSDPERTPALRVAMSPDDDGGAPPSNPEWWRHAGQMAAAAWGTPRRARRRDGAVVDIPPNVLVLTTSYEDCARIGEAVGAAWRDAGVVFTDVGGAVLKEAPSLLVHQRGTSLSSLAGLLRDRTRRRLSGCEGGSVLVTPAGWEGLDLPGLLHHVVITRLPWPPPASEAEIQVLSARLKGRGRALGVLNGHRKSAMLRKLRQAIGRGIRAASDDCTVWFADPRMPLPPGRMAFAMGPPHLHGTVEAAAHAVPLRFAGAYAAARLWPDSDGQTRSFGGS